MQLQRALSQVGSNEDPCITGHGNDTEVGDEESYGSQSWTWSASELVGLLGGNLPNNDSAAILMEVCSESMTSFAANLAESLRKNGVSKKVWLYGHTKAVDITHAFPDPANLAKHVELGGHQC